MHEPLNVTPSPPATPPHRPSHRTLKARFTTQEDRIRCRRGTAVPARHPPVCLTAWAGSRFSAPGSFLQRNANCDGAPAAHRLACLADPGARPRCDAWAFVHGDRAADRSPAGAATHATASARHVARPPWSTESHAPPTTAVLACEGTSDARPGPQALRHATCDLLRRVTQPRLGEPACQTRRKERGVEGIPC